PLSGFGGSGGKPSESSAASSAALAFGSVASGPRPARVAASWSWFPVGAPGGALTLLPLRALLAAVMLSTAPVARAASGGRLAGGGASRVGAAAAGARLASLIALPRHRRRARGGTA